MASMSNNEPTYELAVSYAQEKQYDKAIEIYKDLISKNPEADSLRLALAWTYRDAGYLGEAISQFEELLEKELSRKIFTGFAFDELVRIYTEKRDFKRLIEVCRKAVQSQPDDLSLLFTLGHSLLKANLPQEAAEVFEKLCRLESDATLYLTALGEARIAAGDFDRASECYEQAIALDPEGADRYFFNLGEAFLKAGAFARAETSFIKAIHCKGDCATYYCALGDACIRQGKLDQADVAYENACRINPQHRAAFYNRFGLALLGAGQSAEAVGVLEKAVSLDPGNPFLQQHLAEARSAAGLTEKPD